MTKSKSITWQNRIIGSGEESPDQLLANPANWRGHPKYQQDVLTDVLSIVGWVDRVIINKRTGFCVDGHLRIALAITHNQPMVPVDYVDLDDAEESLILATFDPISALAFTDAAKLDELLRDVQTDSAAVQQMLSELAVDAGLYADTPTSDAPEAQVDKAEELQQKWQVKRGDLWVIPSKSGKGEHRLLCGDSTSADDVSRVMDKRAALAWFDPPFGISLNPPRGLTDAIQNDGNIDARMLWAKFLPLLYEQLIDDAHVFLCQGWTEFDWTLPLIEKHFTLKSKVVWFKNVWGIGYYTRPQHEDIIYCWKGTPSKPISPVADVWQIARESAPVHAAEKPPELSHMAIETFSQRGEIIADWFSGVGGSTIACEQTGRLCRAIEIEPKYVSVTLQRLADMGLEPRLLAI